MGPSKYPVHFLVRKMISRLAFAVPIMRRPWVRKEKFQQKSHSYNLIECHEEISAMRRVIAKVERREGNDWWRLLEQFEYIARSMSPVREYSDFLLFICKESHHQEHAASRWLFLYLSECSGSGRIGREMSAIQTRKWKMWCQTLARMGSPWYFSHQLLKVTENIRNKNRHV